MSRTQVRRLAMMLAGAMALAMLVAPTVARPRHEDGGGFQPRGLEAGPRGRPAPPEFGQQFDPRRHNGYWVGPRWYYGPPPNDVERTPGFRPGFAPFQPGAYLPQQYQAFVVGDWARFHLRRPPFGYHWVEAGDEFLLVSVSTGQIFDVVPAF